MKTLVAIVLLFGAAVPAAAAPDLDRSAAELLPDSTILYAEMSRPAAVLDALFDGPVHERLRGLDAYRDALASEGMRNLTAVVALLELRLGMGWRDILRTVTSEGAALGVDGTTGGAALVVRGSRPETLAGLRDGLLALVRADAARKGQPDPIATAEYRGVTAHRAGEASFAVVGPWLVVTNQPALGRTVLDNLLGEPASTLAGTESFRAARRLVRGRPSVWLYADTAALRAAGAAPDLFRERAENPGAELLLGGVLEHLRRAPFATASLSVSSHAVGASLVLPHDPAWIDGPRGFFFGPEGAGAAPALLEPAGTVLSMTAHRDVGKMWLHAGDLFDEKVNDQMAQAEGVLTTLFSGLDFGEEVLGALAPGVRVVAVRRTFADGTARPAVRLPAFATVLRLRDPETMRPRLRRAFQSLIGFLNVQGATQGRPQLDLETTRDGELTVVSATPVPEKDLAGTAEGPMALNFSPALAFFGDRMVLASTRELALELVRAKDATETEPANTRVRIDGAVLREILEDNRRHLVSGDMLKKGRTRAESEKAMGALFDVLGLMRSATAELAVRGGALALDLRVDLAAPERR